MRPSIVLFEDSVNHYSRSANVVLRGYSGYNTRWAARVAERAVASIAGPVRAVTVFFGANDAALPDRASKLQHVPVAEYKDNLRAICALLKKRWPSVVVILITPPPVDEDGRLPVGVLKHTSDQRCSGPPQASDGTDSVHCALKSSQPRRYLYAVHDCSCLLERIETI
ncbi:hypothetical protein EJB05_46160, partial [Eragrostis curvula]